VIPLSVTTSIGLAALCVVGVVLAAATGGTTTDQTAIVQPVIGVRVKAVLTVTGRGFKDSNGNGALDPYEDWRLAADDRVNDLVARMTLAEKVGVMLIETLNADCGGTVSPVGVDFISKQQMSHFIFRNPVTATPACSSTAGRNGQSVTPMQAAQFTNAVQQLREATRLGIPALFKSNARNHIDPDARAGINESAGAFSAFPKEPGIAAAALGMGDMSPVKDLALVAGEEWRSIGLRGMYGYMADLSTEPRWFRIHETFSEDADLNANIVRTLVEHLQGGPLNPRSPVALTIKHFPGGGPQELGLDPHYTFGKTQVYSGGHFGDHLKPFIAAINAGVSAIMPYYGVPIDATYDGVKYDQIGMAFSKQIVTDLLRDRLGFKGYVNSDTGVINSRAWGLESQSVPARVATAINGGTDMLSGFSVNETITDLVAARLLGEARVDTAARRILKEQFLLGLFENPYVDPSRATRAVGQDAFRARGLDVQRNSIVLLQNRNQAGSTTLPLKAGARLYVMGDIKKANVEPYGFIVTDGNAAAGQSRPSAAGNDYAVISVTALNPPSVTRDYNSSDPATGANPAWISPITRKTYGADDPTGLDNGLVFGGSFPSEASSLSFTAMAASRSWQIKPSLSDIKAVMNEVGVMKTIIAVYFRQPFVLDDASGLKNAGAILAHFSVSDTALMDVLSGRFKPRGKLPFALANSLQAVLDNDPDAPGYPTHDTLYPYGFGLTY
jgi:beta-glucosidase